MDAYQTFANDKQIRQWTTTFNTIYLCMYIFIISIEVLEAGVFKDFPVVLLRSKI